MSEESQEENERHKQAMDLKMAIEELKAENYLLRDILGQLLKIKLLPEEDTF